MGVAVAQHLAKGLNKVDLYKSAVYRSAMRSRERHTTGGKIDIPLSDGFPSSRMIVTAQYPQTMMLVLQFDQETHLTLEIGANQKLYGLPAKLAYDNPHFAGRLLLDILPPLVDTLKLTYPSVERDQQPLKETIEVIQPRPKTIEVNVVSEKTNTTFSPVREKYVRLPKRILTPLTSYLTGPVPLVQQREVKPQNPVSYSKAELVDKLGKRANERLVDRIMRDVRDFEYGRGEFKKLNTHTNDLWEITSGNWRIILRTGEGNTYLLEAVLDRKNLVRWLAS